MCYVLVSIDREVEKRKKCLFRFFHNAYYFFRDVLYELYDTNKSLEKILKNGSK